MPDKLNSERVTLTPFTVPAGVAQNCVGHMAPCSAPGSVAYVQNDGYVVCTEAAEHMTTCTDADCDHPTATIAAEPQAEAG